MLILSRKTNESIVIGGNIEIVVLGVEGDTVKLGIHAPKEVDVHRKEIYLLIQEENKAAVTKTKNIEDMTRLFKK